MMSDSELELANESLMKDMEIASLKIEFNKTKMRMHKDNMERVNECAIKNVEIASLKIEISKMKMEMNKTPNANNEQIIIELQEQNTENDKKIDILQNENYDLKNECSEYLKNKFWL